MLPFCRFLLLTCLAVGCPADVVVASETLVQVGDIAMQSNVSAVSSASVTGSGPGGVTIGLMDSVGTSVDAVNLREGLALLAKPLEKDFLIRWRDIVTTDAVQEVRQGRPDFLILPTDQIAFMEKEGLQVFRLLTRKPHQAKAAAEAIGSLVVTRADRDDLRSLSDLKDRHVAADTPTSLSGWLAVEGELAKAGHDYETFFGRVSFLNLVYPNAVSAVLSGSVDAAILPTCLLETLEAKGLINPGDLKPVGLVDSDALACRHSTSLYPDVSVVAFEWTPEDLVRRMTVSLLSESHDGGYAWSMTVGTTRLTELYRLLAIGPYEHLRIMSPAAIYARWKGEIHFALCLLLIFILNEVRLRWLVRRRTAELSEALSALKASQAEAAVARDRLGALERKNIVAQMSGMIAHEIRSPVGAIRNFAAVVKVLLKEPLTSDPNAKAAVEGIDREALRIAGIVDRVRGYVKNRTAEHTPIDLAQAVRRGLQAFRLSGLGGVPVSARLPDGEANILGDGLELELLVVNLVKNGAEAVLERLDARGRIEVRLLRQPAAGGLPSRWVLTVSDNGNRLTEEQKARLTHSFESVKPDGLGLGLSIVRGIADSHGASIDFHAKPEGGVEVNVTFDELATPTNADVAATDDKETFDGEETADCSNRG